MPYYSPLYCTATQIHRAFHSRQIGSHILHRGLLIFLSSICAGFKKIAMLDRSNIETCWEISKCRQHSTIFGDFYFGAEDDAIDHFD